jgi:hypothetical protein
MPLSATGYARIVLQNSIQIIIPKKSLTNQRFKVQGSGFRVQGYNTNVIGLRPEV